MQAVQLAEQGPRQRGLDDIQAMREAHAAFEGGPDRVLERAALLAPQLGLDHEMRHWRGRLLLVAAFAALLVGLLSYALVSAVVGSDRRINAMAALVAVLAPHLLSLLLWLAALVFGGSGGGFLPALLRASTRIPGLGGESSRLLLEAVQALLQRGSARMSAWALGLLNHAVWSLAFVFTLLGLLAAFSFMSFQLTWETTILDASSFARFASLTGWLPAQLGFATPDVGHLLEGSGDHRGWAIWLLGCTLVYGLGLRLLCFAISALVLWTQLRPWVGVDVSDPYVRRLLVRFEAMQSVEVQDPEHRPSAAATAPRRVRGPTRPGLALIGYELPQSLAWPPLPAVSGKPELLLQARCDGSVADKRQLLAQLQSLQAQGLLLVCNAAASPDRATERFLRDAGSQVAALAVLLAGGEHSVASLQRWRQWLMQLDAPPDAVFDEAVDAQAWAVALGGQDAR